jgi:hypothetical protein
MDRIETWAREALLHAGPAKADAARELLRHLESVGTNPQLAQVLRQLLAERDRYERALVVAASA